MYDYLIVGAGLFGATCAQQLCEQGKRVLVIDKRPHIAGNCYTDNVDGIIVHRYGPHVFHTNSDRVWEYVNQFTTMRQFTLQVLARGADGDMWGLPFDMGTFHKAYATTTPQEVRELVESFDHHPTSRNAKSFALRSVGYVIYEQIIRGYTTKQWGRDPEELPAFIVGRLPIRLAYDKNYFNDIYQGIPDKGYTAMVDKMLHGADVRVNTPYDPASLPEHKSLIYTGAIDRYFDYQFGPLDYRSLRFETEMLPIDNYQGAPIINECAIDVPYTRTVEHKHFMPWRSAEHTVITREYPQDYVADENEPFYPINDDKNKALYRKYLSLAMAEGNVHFGGRLGQYQYYNMDQVIGSALSLCQKLQ
jgi:UDP-galactopyranose mutase